MDNKEFERRKRAIWTRHQKSSAIPLLPEFQGVIERMVRVSRHHDETLDDLDGFLFDFVPALEHIPQSANTGKHSGDNKPKKRYKKCFQRRVYLVHFVAKVNEPGRIDWKRTVTEWNKTHPSDMMSLPVLKAAFYAARREYEIRILWNMYGIEHLIRHLEQVSDFDTVDEWKDMHSRTLEQCRELIAISNEKDPSGKLSKYVTQYTYMAWERLGEFLKKGNLQAMTAKKEDYHEAENH